MDAAEAALVEGLRRGDAAAFDRVYARHNARLYGFLCRLVRRRDVAEDLLQETWLRLARHAHRLEPDTRLRPWLFTVARNLHRSYCRWRFLDDRGRGELTLARFREPAGDSPYDAAAAGEMARRLEEAVAGLPLEHREVVLLVAVERMEHADAAAVLGLRPEAFRKRLSRARAKLAAALEAPAKERRAVR